MHRPDGVAVWLPSFSRKHRVPHDLAHAVTERELGMAHGVFGSIMHHAVEHREPVRARDKRARLAR